MKVAKVVVPDAERRILAAADVAAAMNKRVDSCKGADKSDREVSPFFPLVCHTLSSPAALLLCCFSSPCSRPPAPPLALKNVRLHAGHGAGGEDVEK
jgi:hypothetical protein